MVLKKTSSRSDDLTRVHTTPVAVAVELVRVVEWQRVTWRPKQRPEKLVFKGQNKNDM